MSVLEQGHQKSNGIDILLYANIAHLYACYIFVCHT